MRWGLYAFGVTALGLSVSACVGDAATPPPPDAGAAGEEGNACYADETCNKNKPWLKCLSKLCVNVGTDAGADAPPDAPASDASDGGSATCPVDVQSVAQSVRCAGSAPCAQYCCLLTSAYFCNPSDCPGNRFECDDVLDCAGKRCCLNATVAALACPVSLSGASSSVCSTSCSSSQVEMCGQGDSCSKGTCVKMRLYGNDYGVCL